MIYILENKLSIKFIFSLLLFTSLPIYSSENNLDELKRYRYPPSFLFQLYDEHIVLDYKMCDSEVDGHDEGYYFDIYDRNTYKLLISKKIYDCTNKNLKTKVTKLENNYFYSSTAKKDNFIVIDANNLNIKHKKTLPKELAQPYITDEKHFIALTDKHGVLTFYDSESFTALKNIRMTPDIRLDEKLIKKLLSVGFYEPANRIYDADYNTGKFFEFIESRIRWNVVKVTNDNKIVLRTNNHYLSHIYDLSDDSLTPINIKYDTDTYGEVSGIYYLDNNNKFIVATHEELKNNSCIRYFIHNPIDRTDKLLLELLYSSPYSPGEGHTLAGGLSYKNYLISGIDRDIHIMDIDSLKVKVIPNVTADIAQLDKNKADKNHIEELFIDSEKKRLLVFSFDNRNNRWFDLEKIIEGEYSENVNLSKCGANN